jgi:hypothetical protein
MTSPRNSIRRRRSTAALCTGNPCLATVAACTPINKVVWKVLSDWVKAEVSANAIVSAKLKVRGPLPACMTLRAPQPDCCSSSALPPPLTATTSQPPPPPCPHPPPHPPPDQGLRRLHRLVRPQRERRRLHLVRRHQRQRDARHLHPPGQRRRHDVSGLDRSLVVRLTPCFATRAVRPPKACLPPPPDTPRRTKPTKTHPQTQHRRRRRRRQPGRHQPLPAAAGRHRHRQCGALVRQRE